MNHPKCECHDCTKSRVVGTINGMGLYSQVGVSPIPDGMTEQEFIEKVETQVKAGLAEMVKQMLKEHEESLRQVKPEIKPAQR